MAEVPPWEGAGVAHPACTDPWEAGRDRSPHTPLDGGRRSHRPFYHRHCCGFSDHPFRHGPSHLRSDQDGPSESGPHLQHLRGGMACGDRDAFEK
jgi:hypothetical protein